MKEDKETMTFTTSTNMDDDYFDHKEMGYKDGYKVAIKEMNDRLISWLMVGFFTGCIFGGLYAEGGYILLTVLALIYLVDKVNKITSNIE